MSNPSFTNALDAANFMHMCDMVSTSYCNDPQKLLIDGKDAVGSIYDGTLVFIAIGTELETFTNRSGTMKPMAPTYSARAERAIVLAMKLGLVPDVLFEAIYDSDRSGTELLCCRDITTLFEFCVKMAEAKGEKL